MLFIVFILLDCQPSRWFIPGLHTFPSAHVLELCNVRVHLHIFLADLLWPQAQVMYSYITCLCRTHVHAAVLNNRNVFLFFCFFVFVFVWIFCSVVYQDGFYGADLYVSTHTGAFSTPSPDKPAFFFLFLWFGLVFFKI